MIVGVIIVFTHFKSFSCSTDNLAHIVVLKQEIINHLENLTNLNRNCTSQIENIWSNFISHWIVVEPKIQRIRQGNKNIEYLIVQMAGLCTILHTCWYFRLYICHITGGNYGMVCCCGIGTIRYGSDMTIHSLYICIGCRKCSFYDEVHSARQSSEMHLGTFWWKYYVGLERCTGVEKFKLSTHIHSCNINLQCN